MPPRAAGPGPVRPTRMAQTGAGPVASFRRASRRNTHIAPAAPNRPVWKRCGDGITHLQSWCKPPQGHRTGGCRNPEPGRSRHIAQTSRLGMEGLFLPDPAGQASSRSSLRLNGTYSTGGVALTPTGASLRGAVGVD